MMGSLIRRRLPLHTVSVSGTLKIFNTIEEFKDTSTKKRLFDDLVAQVRRLASLVSRLNTC